MTFQKQQQLGTACLRAHAAAQIARRLGFPASPGVVPNPDTNALAYRGWIGVLAFYGKEPVEVPHRRVIGLAGVFAEMLNSGSSKDPRELLDDFAECRWLTLTDAEQKLAEGYTQEDVAVSVDFLVALWNDIHKAAAVELEHQLKKHGGTSDASS